ncbi:small integral membrane protein 24 [Dromiciops gliroides]|uniref:small integral membrane protein 24 n=1 Tax=Dromiciops gliroides TaxID=33562 RepID=UPI001CC70ABA|nr:small integral membrane protein 24 [Dromiciops gliroides]
MELQETIFVLFALSLSSVDAQEVIERRLEPWLVGLTAVVGFLFIVFVLMLANRLWCKKRNNEEESGEAEATVSPYENILMRKESESPKEEKGHTNEALESDEKTPDSSDAKKFTSL